MPDGWFRLVICRSLKVFGVTGFLLPLGEAAHLAFLDDQRFLIVRDVLSDIANQIVILAARFNVLAKLAVFLASAFSVVVWTQCLLAGNFFELFNHKIFLLYCIAVWYIRRRFVMCVSMRSASLLQGRCSALYSSVRDSIRSAGAYLCHPCIMQWSDGVKMDSEQTHGGALTGWMLRIRRFFPCLQAHAPDEAVPFARPSKTVLSLAVGRVAIFAV